MLLVTMVETVMNKICIRVRESCQFGELT